MRKPGTREFGFGKLLVAAFGIAALGGGTVSYADEAQLSITSTIGNVCAVDATAFGNKNITFDDITDENGTLITASVMPTIDLGTVTCNYGATVSIKSANGGFIRQGDVVNLISPFIDKFNYTAKVDWGGALLSLTTNGNPDTSLASKIVPEARSDILLIDISTIPDPDTRLVSGIYKDTLTVKVGSTL